MHMQKCLASTTNVFDLLHLKPAIQDAPGALVLTECRGGISFRNLSFSYGQDAKALQDINLEVEPGKQYALVGASGAGKTTMLSLILRFYDPQAGVIELDGRDLRSITQQSLREHIGIVTQDTFLFHDTIYENIRYGRRRSTPPPSWPTRMILSWPSRRVTTPSSGTKAACSRAASSSGLPSRARCSRTPPFCCWMRQPRRSIPNRNA